MMRRICWDVLDASGFSARVWLEPGNDTGEPGPASMRIAAVFLTFTCLAACSEVATQSASEHALIRQDGWRQQQSVLDAEAILEGMAQARLRAEQQARMAR
jgi:hypothetical protein